MLATVTISGSAPVSTQTACGRSRRTMRSTTMRCSRRSLSERRRRSPRWSSTAGSELRRVEPARATVETPAPERRTRSSGLAPMKAASGVPAQKQKQAGNCSLIAPKIGPGSWAAGASTITSRASTTFSISPAAIRPVAFSTAASKARGGFALRIVGRSVGCGSSRGRDASARRPASRAASSAARRSASSPGPDDRVDGDVGLLPAPHDRDLGQEERAGLERAPGRRAAALGVEGEAAEPDRAGPGGQPARRLDHRVAPRFADLPRDLVEAPRSAPGGLARDAHPGQRELAVGLLPAEPAVARQAGGEDRGGRIGDVGRGGDADQRPPSPAYPARESPEKGLSRDHGRWRSRRCGPFRPARGGGPSARTPRFCRPSR